MTLNARAATWRFTVLTGLRWLPVGFLIPIYILLPLSRGLSLTQVGIAFAAQGMVVLALELPTGGLSDSWGRRPVLLLSTVVGTASIGLLLFADSFAEFVAVWALQGVYRALDSGPLEAWYVDATLAANPKAKLEGGLSIGSSVLSGAIAVGALASGGLIALDPFEDIAALTLPVLIALAFSAVSTLAVAVLMTEQRPPGDRQGLTACAREVPRVVRDGIGLVRGNRVLLALVGVEVFWGFSMVTFEQLVPVRLAEIVDSADDAAALMGPVSSAGWFACAIGAGLVTVASRRFGIAPTAAAARVLQGLTVVSMGIVAGPVGLITAYVACYTIHGASSPLHMTLLHHEVTGEHRSTMISLNSMVSQPAGALGTVALTALAEGASVTTALIVGGVVLALAAPLYLPAWRAEQARAADGAPVSLAPDDVAPLV